MRKKETISFSQKFPNADPLALDLLQRLLAFDPKDRPTAEEVIMLLQSLMQTYVYLWPFVGKL
jgi:serine/threonine protein kinase